MKRPQSKFLHPVWVAACFTGVAQFITAQPLPGPWRAESGGRSAPLAVPSSSRVGFTLQSPAASGVRFTNLLAQERHLTNQTYLNGSGVTAGDMDGDGLVDLYFCGLDGPNALFRNRGNWRFDDATDGAGLRCTELDATGAAFADLDGDGDLDLVVNSLGGGTHLFLNDGRGRFTRPGPVLNPRLGGTSPALGDVDGDGDLDLYVANYRTSTIRDMPNTRFSISTTSAVPRVSSIDGRPLTDPLWTNRFNFTIKERPGGKGTFAYDENGEPDAFFRNDGAGRFTPVEWTGGVFLDEDGRSLSRPPFEWGLSVAFRDLNGDGAPDIHVCNDFKAPDRIWLNDGRGRFRALPRLALRQTCLSSMGADFADVNRDGHLDFIVVDMLSRDHTRRFTQRIEMKPDALPIGAIDNRPQSPRNTFFLGRGDGTWAEIAHYAGLEAAEWAWAPVFLDVDLDGWEDLLISNGFERDNMNMDVVQRLEQIKKTRKDMPSLEQLRLRTQFPRLDTPNLAFRNLGNLRFQEMSAEWGFHERGISQGMCLADLDNDGDLDVILNNMNGPAGLYRNDTAAPRLAVRLKGLPPNTRGIGAKIEVRGGPVSQSQEMMAGGRYLSSDDPMRVFAAGSLTNTLAIEVTWSGGRRSLLTGVQANRLYEIDEASAQPSANPKSKIPKPQFQDVSSLLTHAHHEEPFDDFARQPTLPHRLSQLGPGASWCDADADGWDDLVVPAGKGGRLAVFRNDGKGGFCALDGPFGAVAERDQTAVLPWPAASGTTLLLVGQASDELSADGSCARAWPLSGSPLPDAFPALGASAGPMAMADVNGDGQLELFVGGRFVPGRWPESAPSALFRGSADGLTLDEENTRRLAGGGLVSGAIFSDLDGDGDPDLALACEWGPVKIFRNDEGVLAPWTWDVKLTGSSSPTMKLGDLTGLWTSLTAADFDGDGRLDLAAGNWGCNTRYESFRQRPLRLFHGEFGGDGVVHAIEGYEDPSSHRLLPLQPFYLIGLALPAVRARLGTFESYAKATLLEIHGEAWKSAKELRAVRLESTVFLNRGDRFEAVTLPVEAQFAPAIGICATDFDGDGHEDLFLSQNWFAVPADTSRLDAGRGLLLRGDGRGGFQSVAGQDSGLKIYGEQRGAAVCDYDADGRVDLAVAQNGAETKLYRNVAARPGLRVRLVGPAGNPSAVGAVLRLRASAEVGAAREIHAGSGYWSCDSAVTVLGAAAPPTTLEVRWPGGKATKTDLPSGVHEVTLDAEGKLVRSR